MLYNHKKIQYSRCKSLRTPANTLVINLAFSDFCMLAKSPIAIYNSFNEGPATGDIGNYYNFKQSVFLV